MALEAELSAGPRDHVVLFYPDEPALVDPAGEYLLGAISRGGVAIAILTSAHRRALDDWLAKAGVDVAGAQASGSYLALDAAETISKYVVGDWADPAKFWHELSPLLRGPAEAGRSVRVLGEMVALLWDSGLPSVAIEVEAMWNEIGRQYPFALACAYRTPSLSDDGELDALTEVCRAHVAVLGDPPSALRGWRF